MSSVFLLLLFVTISIHDRFQLLPTHAYPPPLSLMSANIARPHYIYPLPHSLLGTCGELFLLKSKKNTGKHLYLKRYLVLNTNYAPADLTMPDRAIQTQINADTASGTGRPSTTKIPKNRMIGLGYNTASGMGWPSTLHQDCMNCRHSSYNTASGMGWPSTRRNCHD